MWPFSKKKVAEAPTEKSQEALVEPEYNEEAYINKIRKKIKNLPSGGIPSGNIIHGILEKHDYAVTFKWISSGYLCLYCKESLFSFAKKIKHVSPIGQVGFTLEENNNFRLCLLCDCLYKTPLFIEGITVTNFLANEKPYDKQLWLNAKQEAEKILIKINLQISSSQYLEEQFGKIPDATTYRS